MAKALLAGGAVGGPLFVVVLLAQDYTRAGFDAQRHPLSLLSLGDWGWVQIANFVVTGLAGLAVAAGLWRRRRAGRWGPLLIAGYGLGLIVAGVFRADPQDGYPPGVPEADGWSWHGTVHALAALVIFGSAFAACSASTVRFVREREHGWAVYCAATAVAVLVFYLVVDIQGWPSPINRADVAVIWGWPSVLALRELHRMRRDVEDAH